MNKFDKIKEIPHIHDYDVILDPTVIPVVAQGDAELSVANLPAPLPRNTSNDYYTSADFHALYKSGKITPSDVVEVLLPLLQRDTNPPGQFSVGFISSRADLIRAAAKASTERYKEGKPLSALDGVPLAVKDEVHLTGYKRTLGSRLDRSDKHDRTAWCVQKWQDAGAIIIGKTNMHEIGMDTTNNNQTWGTPLNPHNQGYYTGGSSGGSAYAIASGLVPIALGVDGGGSIRLPSSYCGVYGLKPTHSRVSARAGTEQTDSVAVNGPMASNIDDLALAYRVMAQPDPLSKNGRAFPNPLALDTTFTNRKAGKKYLGLVKYWIDRSDSNVLNMFNAAIEHYVSHHGYEVVEIDMPLLPQGQKAHAMTILSEARAGFTTSELKQLSWHNQLLLNVAGSHASAQDFIGAQKLRHLQMAHLAWLWDTYPGLLILTPTTPAAGWKIAKPSDVTSGYGVSDGDMSLRSMEYVFLANWTGAPAISIPMGWTADENVPVGLMAMGEWGSEEQLLAFGKEGESLLKDSGGIRRPKGENQWFDLLGDGLARKE